MIDSILRKGNNLLNKLNRKNVTVITFILILVFVTSLRANAINLSTEYTEDLEFQIRNIPSDQLYNSSFVHEVPVSILRVEGNGKSIDVKYVTLVNLISGKDKETYHLTYRHMVQLSTYFRS